MTDTEIMNLLENDLNEFRNKFGEQKLNQIIKSGNLPVRRETLDKINTFITKKYTLCLSSRPV